MGGGGGGRACVFFFSMRAATKNQRLPAPTRERPLLSLPPRAVAASHGQRRAAHRRGRGAQHTAARPARWVGPVSPPLLSFPLPPPLLLTSERVGDVHPRRRPAAQPLPQQHAHHALARVSRDAAPVVHHGQQDEGVHDDGGGGGVRHDGVSLRLLGWRRGGARGPGKWSDVFHDAPHSPLFLFALPPQNTLPPPSPPSRDGRPRGAAAAGAGGRAPARAGGEREEREDHGIARTRRR